MSRIHTAAALLAIVALALFGAGCGDDEESGDSGSAGSAPTKAEYLEEGNAICAEYNQQLDELFPQIPGRPGTPAFDSFTEEEILPILEEQISEVDALTPPEGDEETTQAIFDAANEGLGEVQENPSALAGDAFAEANRLANEYGLTECGG